MLKLYKIKHCFHKNKFANMLIMLIFIAGFITSGIYVNLITDSDFLKSSEALGSYINGMSSARYNYNDEIILAGIFFGSFFIFGKWIVSFFVFRYGFLTGYLCTFLIKAYWSEGILPCLSYLFFNLIMIFPFIFIIALLGFDISSSFLECLSGKPVLKNDLSKKVFVFVIFFVISLIAISILSRFKMNIFLSLF